MVKAIVFAIQAILVLVSADSSKVKCPDAKHLDDKLFEHFECTNDSMVFYCNDDNIPIDVGRTFTKLNNIILNDHKQFKSLTIANCKLTHLTSHVFSEITFDEIKVSWSYFAGIDQDAFAGTNRVTKLVSFVQNFEFPSQQVMATLTKFDMVEKIELVSNRSPEPILIPDGAFENHTKLESLVIGWSPDSPLAVKQIGARAFANMINLKSLYIKNNDASMVIGSHAFAQAQSGEKLTIEIHTFDHLALSPDSLADIGRPCQLNYMRTMAGSPLLEYLDETVFVPYFEGNPSNTLDVYYSSGWLDCESCRNYWLVKHPQYYARIVNKPKCYMNSEITDSGNFKNCH